MESHMSGLVEKKVQNTVWSGIDSLLPCGDSHHSADFPLLEVEVGD